MIANHWKYIIGVLAVLSVLGVAYFQGRGDGRAHCEAAHKAEAVKTAEKRRAEQEKANAETVRRYQQHTEIINATMAELDKARADAAAAADAGERLRREISRLRAARKPAGNTALAAGGQTTGTTGDLLSIVQQRLDEAADGVARHADEARTAGRACERAYDALTSK